MTQMMTTKTRLDQAVELVNQLSLDEIKQLFQRVPMLQQLLIEYKADEEKRFLIEQGIPLEPQNLS